MNYLERIEYDRARHKKAREENPEKVRAQDRERNRRRRNDERVKARNKVKVALRNGTLVKPNCCEYCGVSGVPLEAHHEDYTKPLDVRFICEDCHGKTRRKGAKICSISPNIPATNAI